QILLAEYIAGTFERRTYLSGDLSFVGGGQRRRRSEKISRRLEDIDRAPLLLHLCPQLSEAGPIIVLRLQDNVAFGSSVTTVHSIVGPVGKCLETHAQFPAE